MKKSLVPIGLVLSGLLTACYPTKHQEDSVATKVQKLENGVIIGLHNSEQDSKFVRLTVINNDIIRVTASAKDSFSIEKSLMVLQKEGTAASWSLQENDTAVVVSTSSLKARVLLATGEVTFTDSTDQVLLTEQKGGGKSFKENHLDGKRYFSIRQKFLSPSDEAFYGLGGHQNGQMNYKNDDVELIQANIVDVVPFVVSNKNYGLLWDNYSCSKFGDPREYQPLNTIGLFDKHGSPGGLSASYYVSNRLVKEVIEDTINYEFLETPQVDNFPKDVAAKGKIIWEGSFGSDHAGLHKFLVYSSGYCRVWVDDTLRVDKWRQNWNPWTTKFKVEIRGKEKHKIKIEWISEGGYLAVKHLDPIPEEEQAKLSLWSEVADEIDYYFNPSSHEPDKSNERMAFNGYCLVIVQADSQAGEIRLKASSEKLKDNEVLIKVK